MNVKNNENNVINSNHETVATEEEVFDKPIDLDHVLVNEIGQFGPYQLTNLLLLAVAIVMSAFPMDFVFSAAAIPHRCRVSECGEDSNNGTFKPTWVLNAIPATNTSTGFASCSRFESQGNGTLDYCPADLFSNTTTECNGEFVYARDNSVVYDFNLGCQEWLRALAGTLCSIGTLLALPFVGYVSDRFGRRIALVICMFNTALLGLLKAFSVNYATYLALQLLQTTLGSGNFSTAYILATEFVGPRYRVLVSATCTTMFALGEIIVGAVAWLIRPWRHIIMILYIPSFITICYYWLLDESVRWQLSKGKFLEADIALRKVARVNKKEISEKSMNALMKPPKLLTCAKGHETPQTLIHDIFQSQVLLRRVLTTPIWWITTTFVYYGLSINATGLSDTMYLNFILTVAIGIPGFYSAMLFLDRIGRRRTLCIGFLLSAASNISTAFVPHALAPLRLIIYLLGMFSISIVMTSIYMYTAELYPTQYRHSLLAFSSMIGRIGSIIAPLTPVLAQYWHGIPSAMFAGMAVLSGVLVLTQPETLGTKLPDTLAEAESIGSPESMISHSCG